MAAAGYAKRAIGHVLGDYAASASVGAVADAHGCDERRIGADEGVFADRRAIFVEAVVIAHDRAGPDVCARADIGVADIREVARFCAITEGRVLHFDEVADLGFVAELRTRTETRERADLGVFANLCLLEVAKGVDTRALGNFHAFAEEDVRLDDHISCDLGIVAKEDRVGIDQRNARLHRSDARTALEARFGDGEFNFGVHAERVTLMADEHMRGDACCAR